MEAVDLPDLGRTRLTPEGGGEILIRTDVGRARQQFTLAHELGHWLLHRHVGLPLADQSGNRAIESFCNDFASNLLLPRTPLARRFAGCPRDLPTASSVAQWAGSSLTAAVAALNDSPLEWQACVASWRRSEFDRSRWVALSVMAPGGLSFRIEATRTTSEALSLYADAAVTPERVDLPVLVNGEVVRWNAQLRLTDSGALTFSPSRSFAGAGRALNGPRPELADRIA
ncbi:MAG: ImmA/IrrE family metallo-endopeptidase [Sporichthyaceae bacterium]